MIILGLGSNIGDRFSHLRRALRLIKEIPNLSIEKISPVYISDALLPDNAPETWNTPYLNLALRCETRLTPYELLDHTKKIEKIIGHWSENHWGPRAVDIDFLAWDNLIQYDKKLHVPHEQLHLRPFAFWPLADVAPEWVYPLEGPLKNKTAAEIVLQWGSRFNGEAPLHCRQIPHRVDTPELIGIVNITPDSFSDGGNYLKTDAALLQSATLANAGAEIIDIGAESTRPFASPIDSSEEWARLESVLEEILAQKSKYLIPPKISVDTRHPATAQKALDLGVDWINDVSGLENPAMREIIASHGCDAVFMHHLGIPADKNRTLPLNEAAETLVYRWAEERLAELEKAGIARDRLIFDVGIGFGKTEQQSLRLVQTISIFRSLGIRLLVGHSRKSFLNQFTPKEAAERDTETVAFSLYLAKQSVDYLRIHNVDLHARALKVAATV